MDLKTTAAIACILAILILPGCASNTKYVPCCKRAYVVNLSSSPLALLDPPQCILDNGENFSFQCNATSMVDIENGTIRCVPWGDYCALASSSDCTKKPGCVWDGTNCDARTCVEIADEISCNASKCFWDEGVCTGAIAYETIPICVDDVQKSCTNERCKAMMCGYTEIVPLPPISSSDWSNNGENNMPFAQSKENPMNLAGTACSFKVMDKKLNNMVKNSKGALWVNSFRFGVGRSFSDFEMSRFFFPSTDAQCRGTVIPNSKQRYVAYNNANDTWCSAMTGNYFECTENGQNFTILETCRLWCKAETNCEPRNAIPANPIYWCRESNFTYDNRQVCKNNCEIVSDPNSCTLDSTTYPFLEPNGNFKMTSDGSKINSTYYAQQLINQYLPSGVSVNELAEFECVNGGQCMSSYCSSSEYMRGRCLNSSNGQRIDCGCGLMSDEKRGLDCSNALLKTDGTSYVMYRSVIKDALDTDDNTYWGRERSTGTYNRGRSYNNDDYYLGEKNSITPFFNPYYGPNDGRQGGKVNQVERTVTLFDDGNVGGEINGRRQNVYRVYIDGGPATNPQPTSGPDIKLFKNCLVPRTSKTGLYTEKVAYTSSSGTTYPGDDSHLNLNVAADDGLGPRAQKMCLYEFVKATPHYAWVNHYWTHYDEMLLGITPTGTDGSCPVHASIGDGSTINQYRYGTYTESPGHDRDEYFQPFELGTWNYVFTPNPRWFWVYEFIFNDTNNLFGICNISTRTFQPYIDVETVGWCEACTYSTLATQSLSKDSASEEIGKTQYLSYKDQLKRYQQANIMSVLDVQNIPLTFENNNRAYPSFGAASLLCGYSPIARDWHADPPKGTILYAVGSLDLLAAEKGDLEHEWNLTVSNRIQLSRYVPSGAVTYMGLGPISAGECAVPSARMASRLAESASSYSQLRGAGAFMARSLFLKNKCPIAPLVGLAIETSTNKYDDQSTTSSAMTLGLTRNNSVLFNYFYSKREANTCYRVANGQPDYWPDKSVDVFLQNWHPTCEFGIGVENRTKREFETRMNFSLALLSNYSKPSLIWKFSFPEVHQCDESYFLDYLFKHKGDMVDAGIMGLIYDQWKNPSHNPLPYKELQTIIYTPNPPYYQIGSTRAGTPFCALQQSARQVLGISTHTYGQKVYATNQTCMCELCTDDAYASGICD